MEIAQVADVESDAVIMSASRLLRRLRTLKRLLIWLPRRMRLSISLSPRGGRGVQKEWWKNGALLLVTPDCSSLSAIVRKSKWPDYKIGYLYYCYSSRTLWRFLIGKGFDCISCKAGIRYFSLHCIASLYAKYRPDSLEAKVLGVLEIFCTGKLFLRPFLFPSEMMVTATKN